MRISQLYRHIFAVGALACATAASVGITAAVADPVGLWRAPDGGTTRIARCGTALCGTLVTVVPARDANGRPVTDSKNKDPSKHARPLVGVTVLIGLWPSGPNKWSGQLYNPDDGGTYEGHLIEQGATSIRIEGCALGMCGGEDLVRVR
jgi:uncharacterized protein (DUF2147 family)